MKAPALFVWRACKDGGLGMPLSNGKHLRAFGKVVAQVKFCGTAVCMEARKEIEMFLIDILRNDLETGPFCGNADNDDGSNMGPEPKFAVIQGEIYFTFLYVV